MLEAAMSDNQTIWTILWNHAASLSLPGAIFEISDLLPAVVEALKITDAEAQRVISMLLDELDRLPEGRQFFAREANAIVPLSSFLRAKDKVANPVDAYPYEL